MNKLTSLIKQVCLYFDQKIILKALKTIHSFSGQQIQKRAVDKGLVDWREQVLVDFKVWLSQVDNLFDPKKGETKEGETMGGCDLYTLLAEFVSLKKQIQLQNREQSKNIKCLKDFNEFAQQGHVMISLLDEKIQGFNTLEERIKEDVQENAVKVFLDVRDTLVRGVDSGGNMGWASFLLGKKKIDGILKGYGMALRKFDLSLAMLETFPIDTNKRQFDPGTMMAVETRHLDHVKEGMVIDEISGGFTRRNKVIRPAQVIVNR